MPTSRAQRPERRQVRVPCSLRSGAAEFSATTSDISRDGLSLYLVTPEGEVASLFEAGTEVEAEFRLPETPGTVTVRGRVTSTDPDELDARGEPVLSIGLRFVEPPQTVSDVVTRYVKAFRYTVMVIEDDEHARSAVESCLRSQYRVLAFDDPVEALEALEQQEVAAVITDQRVANMSVLELFRRLNATLPYSFTQRIVSSVFPEGKELRSHSDETKLFYYLRKPFRAMDLARVVRSAVDLYATLVERERLQVELARSQLRSQRDPGRDPHSVERINGAVPVIGHSPPMQRVMETMRHVASSDCTVLIGGETGTGKELVARAVHAVSERRKGPFIAVNCAALPESLLESELFGHERGAFTGAANRRAGRFERARGGTLFVDEVGDLPLPMQIKLLRVLQEGTFERLGGNEVLTTDARIIAATHRDLGQLVVEGSFREDLFYRLNVVPLYLPPLRERREDIMPLVFHYLDQFQRRERKEGLTLSARLRLRLEEHPWHGNVRELINFVERMVVLSRSHDVVDWDSVETHAPGHDPMGSSEARGNGGLKERVGAYERELLITALHGHAGNRTQAARELGITRQTLGFKLKKYGLS